MSQTTTLSIHTGDATVKAVIDHVIYEDTDMSLLDYDLHLQGDTWELSADTRWSIDGIESAAARISSTLGCEVELSETWDDRDADEPGWSSAVYRAGVRVSTGLELQVPLGVAATDVVVVPIQALRQWRGWLEQQPFPQIGRVATAIDVLLS